jgi:hypothetical protein
MTHKLESDTAWPRKYPAPSSQADGMRWNIAFGLVVISLIVAGCPPTPSGPPLPVRSKLPDDTTIQWSQADALTIQSKNDPNSDVWNAGMSMTSSSFATHWGG